jgi:hypothetical protein
LCCCLYRYFSDNFIMVDVVFTGGDRVIGKKNPRLNFHGVITEARTVGRIPEFLVHWDGEALEAAEWVTKVNLWKDRDQNPPRIVPFTGLPPHSTIPQDSDESEASEDGEAEDDEDDEDEDDDSASDQSGFLLPRVAPVNARGAANPGRIRAAPAEANRAVVPGRGAAVVGAANNAVVGAPNPVGAAPPPVVVDPLRVRVVAEPGVPEHFQTWTEVPLATDPTVGYQVWNRSSSFNWDSVFMAGFDVPAIKTPMQYFQLMFPMGELNAIIRCTNIQLAAKNHSPITKKLFLRFLGIRLAMSLRPQPGNKVEDYWNSAFDGDTIFESPDFGRKYQMSYSLFRKINENFRLADFGRGVQAGVDPYLPIRSFLDAFNARRAWVVTPGKTIVVDECMCSWKGEESVVRHESVVHITKIQRKPKGVGIEMKSAADGETGILLKLEIQEGKLRPGMPKKHFEGPPFNLPFHVAVLLRLVLAYFMSGRHVVADAAFSSVLSAWELLKRGLWFSGIVKTCSKRFPVDFFKAWGQKDPAPVRGDHCSVITTVAVNLAQRPINAEGWMAKKETVKKFISTFSATTDGDPHIVQRTRRVLNQDDNIYVYEHHELATARTVLVQNLFQFFGAIDLHDRYRQGYLKLEVSWVTKKWWHRMFSTLFGMILTDSFLAYKYDYDTANPGNSDDMMSYFQFLGKLSHALIFNNLFDDVPADVRGRNRAGQHTEEVIQYVFLSGPPNVSICIR